MGYCCLTALEYCSCALDFTCHLNFEIAKLGLLKHLDALEWHAANYLEDTTVNWIVMDLLEDLIRVIIIVSPDHTRYQTPFAINASCCCFSLLFSGLEGHSFLNWNSFAFD